MTSSAVQTFMSEQHWYVKHKTTLLKISVFVVGILFAQAILLEATVPLFVPFYISLMRYDKAYRRFALAGGILGALTLSLGQVVIILIQLLLFWLLSRITFFKSYPIITLLIATTFTQLCWQLAYYSLQVPVLVQLYALYEIAVSTILLLFFRQVFVEPKALLTDWRYERKISIVIIFSLLLMALSRMQFLNISPATLLLQVAICCAAYYGSIATAAFVATIVSVVLSMSQLSFSGMIALYALTGAFVGNAKKLGKYGIALLSIVPSGVFFFYDDTLPLDVVHFTSIAIGALLFIWLTNYIVIAKPASNEVTPIVEQSVHDFQRFTLFLHEMVELSLAETGQQKLHLNDFSVCKNCFRYERCWSDNLMEMKLKDVLLAKQSAKSHALLKAEQSVQEACIRPVPLLQELQHRIQQQQIANQQYYSRKLIGNQLQQMSDQLQQLLKNASQYSESKAGVEEKLLQQLNVFHCLHVNIEKMRHGYVVGSLKVAEEVDEPKLMQKLTKFFKEDMELFEKTKFEGIVPYTKYRFRSAIRYEMEYDIYNKTSASVTGDHVVVTEIERGLQALLVADGMGTGARAQQQAQQLLFLLRQCLSYQLSAQLALSTLQYMLNPTVQDSYATLDMLLFDLKKGELVIWKTGSTATYIVRGEKIIVIESRFAPVGTLQQAAQSETVQLLAGDYIFILTDGIFQSALYEQQERYLQKLLLQKVQHNWSLSTLLYEVLESYKAHYEVDDDVTFIATKIEHTQVKWATVNL